MPLGVWGGRGGNKQIHELGFHLRRWLQIRCLNPLVGTSGKKCVVNMIWFEFLISESTLGTRVM